MERCLYVFNSDAVYLRDGVRSGGVGQTTCLKLVVRTIDCCHHALNLKLAVVFVADMACNFFFLQMETQVANKIFS